MRFVEQDSLIADSTDINITQYLETRLKGMQLGLGVIPNRRRCMRMLLHCQNLTPR